MPSVRRALLGPPQRPPVRPSRAGVLVVAACAITAIVGTCAVIRVAKCENDPNRKATTAATETAMTWEEAMRRLTDESATAEERKNGLAKLFRLSQQAAAAFRDARASGPESLAADAADLGQRLKVEWGR